MGSANIVLEHCLSIPDSFFFSPFQKSEVPTSGPEILLVSQAAMQQHVLVGQAFGSSMVSSDITLISGS
jgi:hypothetical protein